jgi:GntR family transcriptional regulator/MocR family aminotransferase
MRTPGWAELYAWKLDRRSGVPLARQIYMQVRQGVLAGVLAPGMRLPSSRVMAKELGAARASVVAAYEQLLAEGYADGRARSGTYVSAELTGLIAHPATSRQVRRPARTRAVPVPAQAFAEFAQSTAQADERPFNTGRTLVDARTVEVWRKLTHRAVRCFGAQELGYTDPCGFIGLRTSICEYLRTARAVRCEPEQIVITAGTQHAIDIAIRVLLSPGDEVWVEDPGYFLTHRQLMLAKAQLRPIPVDGQGMKIDAGIRVAPRAGAVFVTPSHQFPTGVQLSMARRLELLAWARGAAAYIVEDDYVSEFRYGGPPLASLQGLDDDDRVVYVGTLNKALFPGLRLGYAVVPSALLAAFVSARYLIDRQPPSLYQAVAAEFLSEGHFTAHIRRMRSRYREQRDALATTLTRRAGDHLRVDVPDQGMHLIAYLEEGTPDLAIESAARNSGIIVRAMSRFYLKARVRPGLMLGFSGFPRQLIVPAAVRLAGIIAGARAKRRVAGGAGNACERQDRL